ncbi:MAG: AgmX/PglI C-terminal domain-containing protein [Deltaproteobacteria bacterium]|nr:AgmX/PglI C-terminal domain-containing protein [Deltaproteobacteria bacterium]
MPRKRTITFIPRVLSPRPISFDSSTIIIGSRPDADLVLDDSAEPVHALIRMRHENVELAAFGPVELNGTIVERATLAEGDHLRIGRLSFVFVTTEQDDAPPPAPIELPNLEGALAGVDRDVAGIPTAVLASGESEAAPAKSELRTEVALFWGNELLQVAHFGPGATVRIGEGEGNDFVLAAREIKGKSFVLVEPSDAGPIVRVPSLAPVELDRAGSKTRSARGALVEAMRLVDDRLRIEPSEKIAIALDALTVVVKRVPSTAAVTRPLGERLDQAFVSVLTFTGIAAAFLFGLALSAPKGEEALSDALTTNRRPHTIEVKLEKPKPHAGGPAFRDTAGEMGRKDAPKKHTRNKPVRAEDVGILAILKGTKTATTRVLGPGGLDAAIDRFAGNLRGNDEGDAGGNGGMSTRGNGPGGGGDSLDIGRIGKRGPGGLGDADMGTKERPERDVTIDKSGKPGDGLSHEVIARVLARAQSQMRHCYERELGKTPDLHGKVTLAFSIGRGGEVVDASAALSTLAHAGVEGCLQRVVARLRFPEPKGGGTVSVKYPLVFTTTGR